jgi:hypothetical protein
VTGAKPLAGERIVAVDIIRGLVMVLMAIDHVRVYSGLPPGGPTPGITRWSPTLRSGLCPPGRISAFLLGKAQ